LDHLGASFIAAPGGAELARAGADSEILVAEVAPERVQRAQARFPYLVDCHELQLR
jgi:predicted amidohydrolase